MAKAASIKADPKAQAFLGREFLTWLWFRCESDGGTFELEGGETGVVFDDYVALISEGDDREESILKKGSPHRSAEARTALLVGKLVASAKLTIARGERTFVATVAGETLDLRSVRYPDPEGADAEERTLERLEAMKEIGEILDGLYALFLGVRVSPEWDGKEVPAMQRWIRKKAGAGAGAGAGG